MRYLYHAFVARPDIPLLRLPWNALAMVAAGIAGWWDPMIWAVAGAGEMVYLFTMASNPGFQQWITDRKKEELRGDTQEARRQLTSQLGGAARQRFRKLEEKRRKLEALYRQQRADDLFSDSNIDALGRLSWLYLNLLVAQRNILVAPSSDPHDLQRQITVVERELEAATTDSLRASKSATLQLLRGRVENIRDRQISLSEIEADLARLEAQFDLALEEASLRGRPLAISSNVELSSRLLNIDGVVSSGMDSADTTTTAARTYE